MTVHTVGHSTLSVEDLVGRAIVDVRRFPASRRHPQFDRDRLGSALREHGLRYDWIEALGGRRRPRPDSPHVAWRVEGFRGYADHMETDEFERGLASLLALAAARPTAILCAEAVPWRCHRRLIADALVVRGVDVRHLTGATTAEAHRLTPFARIECGRLVYDREVQGDLPGT